MQYRYTNPNTKRTGIVDAATYQDMANNPALKGYVFEPLGTGEDEMPPAITPPAKFQQQEEEETKKPRSGKTKTLRSNDGEFDD